MIAHVGNVGTDVRIDNASPRKAEITLSAGVPVGDWLIAWFATRCAYDISRPTDSYNWAVAYDTKLNPWCGIARAQIPDTSFAGVMVHIFIAEVQRALVSGDKITALVGNHQAGATWVKCLSVERFSVGADMRLAVTGNGYTGQFVGSGGGDPPAIATDFVGPDREVLYLYGLANEGPIGDSFTWDPDHTQITPAGSNTGTPTNDITVLGSYRIAEVSGNADGVDITSAVDRELAQTMICLAEVKQPVGFPITPILDDFNRADENPLDGGRWDTVRSSYGFPSSQIISNQAAGGGSIFNGFQEKCQEVYVTVADYASSAIHFNASGDVQLGDFQAHGAQWRDGTRLPSVESHSINFGYANLFGEIVVSVVGPPIITWPTGLYTPPPDGSKMGIRREKFSGLWADTLFVDLLDGDGWRPCGTLAYDIAAASPLDDGELSMGTDGRLDDFGGGMIPCGRPFRPQVYRRTLGVV